MCGGGCGSLGAARWRHLGKRKRLHVRGLRRSYSSSEGLGRQLRGEVAAWLGARIQQHRPRSTGRRDSPGFGLPWDRQRPGGPRTARTLLPQLSRSTAPPRSLQALQTEFLPELNPGFQSCPATGAVPPGASRGKQPPLSPAPGGGRAAPPSANT